MRNRTMMDIVKFKIKEINRYLDSLDQRLVLSEQKTNESNEVYWDLVWYRSIDRETEAEEHVFGGDETELFATLTGIEYGVRMRNYVYRI